MSKDKELKPRPCPFHKHKKSYFEIEEEDGLFYGECTKCGMKTPGFIDEVDVIEYLNHRPTEDRPRGKVAELNKCIDEEKYAEGELRKKVAELEAELEKHRWRSVEDAENDKYYIASDGKNCYWLYFNEVWYYAENKKPFPRFMLLEKCKPFSMPEREPITLPEAKNNGN